MDSFSPLLYGLEIGEKYTVLHSYAFESKDYQITNTTPWNYALKLDDDEHPEQDLEFMYRGLQSNQPPFSIAGSPSMIKAKVPCYSAWVTLYATRYSCCLGTNIS